jgi:hypothetical protein
METRLLKFVEACKPQFVVSPRVLKIKHAPELIQAAGLMGPK